MGLGFLKTTVSPIAVDFGVSSLKVLQLSLSEMPTLVAAAGLDTPEELIENDEGRLEWQAEMLPRLIKSAPFKGKRAICTVPATRTYVQHIPVPKVEGVEVKDAVAEQLRTLTGRAPGTLVYRQFEVGEVLRGGQKCLEVIVIAMPREVVLAHVKGLKRSHLECVGVHSDHLATVRAFDSITRRVADADLTSLYVDLGYGTTKVMMSHGKQLVFAKTIPIGGRHIDAALAKEMDCTVGMAHKRRCAGTAGGSWLGQPASPAVAGVGAAARADAAQPAASGGIKRLMNGRSSPSEGNSPGAAVETEEDRRLGATPEVACELADPAPGEAAPARPSRVQETVEALTDEIAMCLRYEQAIFPSRQVGRTIFVGGEARQTDVCRAVARALRLPAQVADPMSRLKEGAKERVTGIDDQTPQPGWTVPIGLCLLPTDF